MACEMQLCVEIFQNVSCETIFEILCAFFESVFTCNGVGELKFFFYKIKFYSVLCVANR